jgi:hypothetical protein
MSFRNVVRNLIHLAYCRTYKIFSLWLKREVLTRSSFRNDKKIAHDILFCFTLKQKPPDF